jgi:hypothetical protein
MNDFRSRLDSRTRISVGRPYPNAERRRPQRGAWSIALVASALAACALGSVWGARPAIADPTEFEIKAALVYNFAKFVEWPAQAFASIGAPLVVGIIGDDEVADALEPTLKGKLINGHPVITRRLRSPAEARSCQLVYIATSERKREAGLIAALRGASVLTVSDLSDFARRGGQINFVLENQRVRFLINPANADSAGLHISAKLLALARTVGEGR